MSGQDILSPRDRETIAQLQLVAKHAIAGTSGGRHRSRAHGTSAEFKEHRQYVAGDELRSLDWKLYGKTDRMFIRQFEDETHLRVNLLVDQSGSMGYAGSRGEGVSKHKFAVSLAACLATLCAKQQDPVGLATFDTEIREFIPARSQTRHLAHLFRVLAQSQTGSETQLADVITQLAHRIRRRGSVIVLISDLLEDPAATITALQQLCVSGHEVIVFQVWDPDELDFPFRQRTEFRSLERRGTKYLVDPASLRTEYLRRLQEFRDQLCSGLSQNRIDLIQCSTENSFTELLAGYLSSRAGQKNAWATGSRSHGAKP